MGVAPVGKARSAPEVGVAHVVAAHPAAAAIDDHDLAVVAEVDAEAVEPAVPYPENADMNPGRLEFTGIRPGEAHRTDPVIEEVDLDARPGPLDQGRFETPAEVIRVNDEKLDENIAPGGGDARQDRFEGGVTVDQQTAAVALHHRKLVDVAENIYQRRSPCHQAAKPVVLAQLLAQMMDFRGAMAVVRCIILDSPGAEDQVEEYGQVREEEKRHHPGDGALTGAAVHDDVENEKNADDVQDQRHDNYPGIDNQFEGRHSAVLRINPQKPFRGISRRLRFGIRPCEAFPHALWFLNSHVISRTTIRPPAV